mmetsp:Transcript_6954/g.22819  ORF Transcript_6954/g.22819 Transcript_6954/m.22819 type:complete len:383 (-) Transcript_6954:453-1601(-)
MGSETIDVKRYDRQIRLWGLDTQRGLLGTRILLLRATGLCNEAAKNLVLAGVGHVSIQDPGIVSADDLASGAVFSMRKTDVGRNRAEAMVEHLQPLNPSVDMAAVTQPLALLSDDFLCQFQYIISTHGIEGVHEVGECVTRLSSGTAARADVSRKRPRDATGDADGAGAKGSNGAHVLVPTRKAEQLPKLLAAGAPGMFGFCALDLLHHQHTVVTKRVTDAKAGEAGAAPAPLRYQVAYPTIADAFGVAWSSLQPRSPRLYCALQLLLAAKSPDEVEALRLAKLAEAGLNETFVTPALSAEFVAKVGKNASTELAPVCAIMGGMVAAEVIKIISGKDAPINNLFLFDAATTSDAAGVIARYGPAFETEQGVNKGLPQLIAEE